MTYRNKIDSYVAKDKDLRKYELSESDWESLPSIATWLELFRSTTTQMSTTKKPMLSTTHAIFRGLQEQLREILKSLPHCYDIRLRRGLVEAQCSKPSDYCYKFDESVYYTWADACTSIFPSAVDSSPFLFKCWILGSSMNP